MNPKVIFSVCLVLTTLSACSGRPAEKEPVGKYQVSKSNNDDGKYRPVKRNEGRYYHMVQPYVHIHDNRELGQYVHIPNPYDGGYGPYSGLNNPYRHDESGNYDKYTTTSTTTRRPTTTTTTTVRPRLFNYYEEGGWKILRQEEEKEKHKYDFLYHTENGIYGEEKAHLHPGAGTAATGYYEYTGDDGELYRVNYKSDHRGFIPEGDHIPTPPPVPDAIKRALEYVAKKKETHGHVQSGQYEHKTDPIRLQNMPTVDRPLNQQQALPQLPRALPQQPKPLPALPQLPAALPQQPRALPALPQLPAALPQQPRALPTLPPLPTLAPVAAQPRFIQYSGNNQYNPLPTIPPQNAAPKAYQAPSLASQRPADQLIQQTQFAQQSQSDQLPKVQVALPQVQVLKPVVVEPVKPVVQLAQLPKLPELPQADNKPKVAEEEQLQSDQPPEDRPQADQPQVDEVKTEPLPNAEIPIKEDQESSQSVESVVFVMPDKTEIDAKIEPNSKNLEVTPEASEQEQEFQPPYQEPEKLKDESEFELTTA